eukprot:TRINITY_DN9654_c0_g1_i2.p1 TRINITY_DN9654_c0_g1~~TRINITY_DN9654_c0_g1_i2.p1  ORF type:complete len:235 (+),score=58.63 TRINITY_DN9654_c0_g1_i2:64-768(+)
MCIRDSYEKITKAHIESLPEDSLQWLYNILDKKAEAESIIYEETREGLDFILLPDLSFQNPAELESLHVLGIVKNRNLRTIRDLSAEHIPLLTNLLEKSVQSIKEKYGIPKEKLRIFLHYPPTYYHLHVHFTHIAKGRQSFQVERCLDLETVIFNLQTSSDYYKNAPLNVCMPVTDPLFQKLQAAMQSQGLISVCTIFTLTHTLCVQPVSYTHLRAHETDSYLVCRLLLEKKKI